MISVRFINLRVSHPDDGGPTRYRFVESIRRRVPSVSRRHLRDFNRHPRRVWVCWEGR